MDPAASQVFNPHLQRVLKTYQTAAGGSLNGPPGLGTALWPHEISKLSPVHMDEYRKAVVASQKKLPSEKGMDYDPFVAPPPFPIQPSPFFIPLDATRSEKVETLLEGEKIACFRVGGEKRLCLPQILNTVLREFSLQQINAVCDDLHIFCSRCNPEQLEDLKVSGILPLNAPSCGLITKTDAERLCNALLHCSSEPSSSPPSPNSFKVYHECFGKCKGIFNPELYLSEGAKCIQCLDCHGLFSPAKFVGHSHKAAENRTCHWGFDSANWRSYLLLAKDQHGKEKLKSVLDEIKLLYDHNNKYKRKQSTDRDKIDSKKIKYEDGVSPKTGCGYRQMSAFRPWSPSMLNAIKEGKLYPVSAGVLREGYPRILPPYLQTGPPVLLNPERVIPLSDSDRYERHFAPNVSLAPIKKLKGEVPEEGLSEKGIHSSRPEHKDYDLSTDTEDSVRSSPLDLDDERSSLSPPVESTLERELELVRGAIFGSDGDSEERREKQFQEFSKLRARQEEQMNRLSKTRMRLRKENELLKINLRESNNLRWSLQKEFETVRIESECRLQNADDTKQRLIKELDSQRIKYDKELVRASNSPDNQELRLRLRHFEELCEQYQRENIWLKEELKQICGEMSAKSRDKLHMLNKANVKIHDNGRGMGHSPRSNGSTGSGGSPKAASSPPERHRQIITSPDRRHPISASDQLHVS